MTNQNNFNITTDYVNIVEQPVYIKQGPTSKPSPHIENLSPAKAVHDKNLRAALNYIGKGTKATV